MSEPLEQVRKARPNVEIDPLTIATAKESFMNEIANDATTGPSFASAGTQAANDPSPPRSGRQAGKWYRSVHAVAAASVLVVASIGVYSIFTSDSESEIATNGVPANEAPGSDGADSDTQESKPGETAELVTDLSTSTFDFEADEIVVSANDTGDFRPNGDIDKYNSLDLQRHAAGQPTYENDDTFESVNGYPDPNPERANYRSETHEIDWVDHNADGEAVEMRIYLHYFTDETDWWVDEVRVYNGQSGSAADWMYAQGEFFKSPLGTAFTGDTEIEVGSSPESQKVDGKLTLTNATLEAFRIPTECRNPQEQFVLASSPGEELIEMELDPYTGYALTTSLVDTETCTLVPSDGHTVSASVGDSGLVSLASEQEDEGLRLGLSPTGIGETTLVMEVTDNASGAVIASSETTISVSVPAAIADVCKQAAAESQTYLLIGPAEQGNNNGGLTSMRFGDTITYGGTAQLWNAETCEPQGLSSFGLEVLSNDTNVANVELGDEYSSLDEEPDAAEGGIILYSVSPVNVGETTIVVRVLDQETGEVVAETSSPVETVEQR